MIARVWRGSVAAADGDAYAGYLEETGVADYRATPGNRGVHSCGARSKTAPSSSS